jgi:hypothetical protein
MGMTISGHGDLIVDNENIGRAEYKVTITVTRRSRSVDGVIWAEPSALYKAFKARELKLRRDDSGYEMTIVVRSHNLFDNMAVIGVSGDPGPLR